MPQIAFISRMTVKAGKEAEFVRLCQALADKVRANESREKTCFYQFFKLREPRRFAVVHMRCRGRSGRTRSGTTRRS